MSSDIVIRVSNLGKKYQIRHQAPERYTALRDVIARAAGAPFRRLAGAVRGYLLPSPDNHQPITDNRSPDNRYPLTNNSCNGSASDHASPNNDYPLTDNRPRPVEDFWALRDVSFELKRGEVLGIIGRNGAGKSTLLKILSRITEPTTGTVEIEGRVASLLEVGTGFHPELTGRENIFLNGAILGMTRAEIRKKFDQIVAFAEVEKFLDTPVKRYSSGMYVRLAFAVAAHLEPEILIVDEVLSVGDTAFQEKCMGKMQDVSHSEGRTVLFVSHNMGAIQSLCAKGIVLSAGKVAFDGATRNAVSHYFSTTKPHAFSENLEDCKRIGGGQARIRTLWIQDDRSRIQTHFRMGESMSVVFHVHFTTKVLNPTFGFNIIADTGVLVSDCRSSHYEINTGLVYGAVECRIKIESISLFPRVYLVEPWVTDSAVLTVFDWVRNAATVVVTSGPAPNRNVNGSHGITFIPTSWNVRKV